MRIRDNGWWYRKWISETSKPIPANAPKPPRHVHLIYIVKKTDGPYYKIGRTQNLVSRVKHLSSQYGEIEIIHVLYSIGKVESIIQQIFKDKHISKFGDEWISRKKGGSTEWFELETDDIKWLKTLGFVTLDREVRNEFVTGIKKTPVPLCPNCGWGMKLKYPRRHQLWFYFWGCQRFPKCNGTRAIDENGMAK